MSRAVRIVSALGVAVAMLGTTRLARAHHEALFGPQSSLAVESPDFLSLQTHTRAYGLGDFRTQETTLILSGGFSPIDGVPWSITLVQPFTYQTTRAPTPPGSTGPFTACDGCFARENTLIATSYRFDFTSLQDSLGKDGNFALLSVALEPPTGNKDYATLRGPFSAIGAAMVGFEWERLSAVALGYYRLNGLDATSSKKGDNFLVGLGVAYTPVDRHDKMLSFQLGVGEEVHARDVDQAMTVDASGGAETIVSPTIVGSPMAHLRIFALVSLPVAQSYRSDSQTDRWRAGVGLIYSFDAHTHAAAALPVAGAR